MAKAGFGHLEIGAIEAVFEGKRDAATAPRPSEIFESYRPSSGTEGMAFDEVWCSRCARDAAWREDESNEPCGILSRTFVHNIEDEEYPAEWIYGRDGRPCCTAFTTDLNKSPRCDKTIDMFEAAAPSEGGK